MLNIFTVFWFFDRRNCFSQYYRIYHFHPGIELDFYRHRIEIAGCRFPMLSFTSIHWQFDDMSILAMECFIYVKHGLNIIFAGREI